MKYSPKSLLRKSIFKETQTRFSNKFYATFAEEKQQSAHCHTRAKAFVEKKLTRMTTIDQVNALVERKHALRRHL